LHESLLELILGVLVDVFLVISHNGFGDGLSDGVNLRSVTASGDAHADIDPGELIQTDDKEGFVDLFVFFVWGFSPSMGGSPPPKVRKEGSKVEGRKETGRGVVVKCGLRYFEAEDFGLGQSEGFSVDFYQAFAGLRRLVC
jgi:hypothetical protein